MERLRLIIPRQGRQQQWTRPKAPKKIQKEARAKARKPRNKPTCTYLWHLAEFHPTANDSQLNTDNCQCRHCMHSYVEERAWVERKSAEYERMCRAREDALWEAYVDAMNDWLNYDSEDEYEHGYALDGI